MSRLTPESKIRLASGHELPQLGFGTSSSTSKKAADDTTRSPIVEAERCVREALGAGYRQIDSASSYRNEAPCGAAIRSLASTIPRSEVFFTSKVRPKGNATQPVDGVLFLYEVIHCSRDFSANMPRGMSYESAKATVANTLRETGLDSVDLMLLHAPYGGSAARKGAWRALVEAVEAGHVRSIGVSNYGAHHLQELQQHIAELESERGGPGRGGVVSVGQWEVHPWLPRPDIMAWAADNGVAVQAFCPLVRGERWGEQVLRDLAAKHGKTAAQVLVRWSLQKGYSPLPKSVTTSRIKENADVFNFELDEEDMRKLKMDSYAPCTWDPTTSALDN